MLRPLEVSLTNVSQERFSYVITAYGINGQIILHQKNKTSVKRPCMFVRKVITKSPIRTLSNYGYPFSSSRYRIITQQQSPQTFATAASPESIRSSSHHNLFQTAFQYYGPLTFQVFTSITLLYTLPLPAEHLSPSLNCFTNSTRMLP